MSESVTIVIHMPTDEAGKATAQQVLKLLEPYRTGVPLNQLDELVRSNEAVFVFAFVLAIFCGLGWTLSRLERDDAGRPFLDMIVAQECGLLIAVGGALVLAVFQTAVAIGLGLLLLTIGLLPGPTFLVVRAAAHLVYGARRIRRVADSRQ